MPKKLSVLHFINVENLFDTINGPNNDEEFLPTGKKEMELKTLQH